MPAHVSQPDFFSNDARIQAYVAKLSDGEVVALLCAFGHWFADPTRTEHGSLAGALAHYPMLAEAYRETATEGFWTTDMSDALRRRAVPLPHRRRQGVAGEEPVTTDYNSRDWMPHRVDDQPRRQSQPPPPTREGRNTTPYTLRAYEGATPIPELSVRLSASADAWTRDGAAVTNTHPIDFPEYLGQVRRVTSLGILSSDEVLLHAVAITIPRTVAPGVTVSLPPGALRFTP